jgi:glucose/mannose transport system permease protein
MSKDLVDLITSKPDVRNKKRKLNGKERFWLIFRYISLTFIWFLVVMPIYVMVINSLKGVKNVYLTNAFKLPEKLDFSAWSVAWSGTDYFPQSISESIFNNLGNHWIYKWLCLC